MGKSTNLRVKNKTGATISSNVAVYVNGVSDDDDSLPTISIASYEDEAKMPAIGITRDEILNNSTGVVKITGIIGGVDTSKAKENSPVYVGKNGKVIFKNPADTNENAIVQQLGVVAKSGDIDSGQIYLFPLEVQTKHAKTHKAGKYDQFIHADQHELGGKDLIDHSKLKNLNSDNHKQYSLANGTRAFTGTVSGVDPTQPTHLATKNYVDSSSSGADNAFLFGDGADGNVTISAGTTTLTRDMYYDQLTVASGGILRPAGFRVFAKTSITVQAGGLIERNGEIGATANSLLGATGGNALSAAINGGWGASTGGASGGNGTSTNGNNGNNASPLTGDGGGGAGGGAGGSASGGSGGSGGTPGTLTTYRALRYPTFIQLRTTGATSFAQVNGGTGGGGGGGGAGAAGQAGRGGGGGGGGAAPISLSSPTISNSGGIQARGGDGGGGGDAAAANTAGGGGGGGGGGALIFLVYNTYTGTAPSASGGQGGAPGAGNGAGNPGIEGSDGASGPVVRMNLTTGNYD